ncbi:ABC transporter permease [Amycolatopsis samaneae]|uniref:FtsX-like permease family protein n=1 Tax=Amycolatopsis samaneae TaxID=664691 RepID=A0ABW5GKQ0_9PSEU
MNRRTGLAAWASDLALGFRLSVGGGRTSRTGIARLVMGTIGIGVAVTVLLFAASVDHAVSERGERRNADIAVQIPAPGVAPLTLRESGTTFRGEYIAINYVHASGPSSPVPPGLPRVPAPGELVVSPALGELLRSDQAELLRPRFAGQEIGTIGQAGLLEPGTLSAYVGADDSLQGRKIYSFGYPSNSGGLNPGLLALLLIGIVSLLAPVFVFVATSARIAGAERDRRLAALRLVGSDLRQVRRIAAAESLVTAVTGLVLGSAAFLLLRQLAPSVRLQNLGVFVSDVTPPWPLVVVIVLAVPALSVLSALFALRGTAIEPLGVVRRAKPVRRRLWWRLLPIAVGVAVLLSMSLRDGSRQSTTAVVAGVACLLVGLPVLLPWLLERTVSRIHGGRPAFQLAMRRLQLDSGTPARVVAGLAVVLAGAIAMQSLLAGQGKAFDPGPAPHRNEAQLSVNIDASARTAATAALAKVPGVGALYGVQPVELRGADPNKTVRAEVADCATWQALAGLQDCRDGAAYVRGESAPYVHSGQSYVVSHFDAGERVLGTWTAPEFIPATTRGAGTARRAGVMLTPGALPGIDLSRVQVSGTVQVTPTGPDFPEHVRNAIAPFAWHASLFLPDLVQLSSVQKSYLAIRAGLLAGSVFTLLLAGVSLLVLGLEQLRERRRTIAMLAATGVPVRVLARSMVWQNGIPLALGIVAAVVTGIALSALGARLTGAYFAVDWLAVGILSAATAALVLLVTAVTLPSLRGASRLSAMRTE